MFIKPCFEVRFINPGGVTNGVKGGVENEQESFGWTANRYFGSGYCGRRSRNSCYDFDCYRNELYGLHDYGNCCEAVPAVGCRVGSRGYRGLHDSARVGVLNEQENTDWSSRWDSRCDNYRCCGSYSSYDKHDWIQRFGSFGYVYIRVQQLEYIVFVDFNGRYGRSTIPTTGCRFGVSGHRGVHDLDGLNPVSGKGSFTPLLFLFSLGFINEFSVSFVGAS